MICRYGTSGAFKFELKQFDTPVFVNDISKKVQSIDTGMDGKGAGEMMYLSSVCGAVQRQIRASLSQCLDSASSLRKSGSRLVNAFGFATKPETLEL